MQLFLLELDLSASLAHPDTCHMSDIVADADATILVACRYCQEDVSIIQATRYGIAWRCKLCHNAEAHLRRAHTGSDASDEQKAKWKAMTSQDRIDIVVANKHNSLGRGVARQVEKIETVAVTDTMSLATDIPFINFAQPKPWICFVLEGVLGLFPCC